MSLEIFKRLRNAFYTVINYILMLILSIKRRLLKPKVFKNDFEKAMHILGFNTNYATLTQIKNRWYVLRRKYSESSNKENEESQKKLEEVNWAYELFTTSMDLDFYTKENIMEHKEDFYNRVSKVYNSGAYGYNTFSSDKELYFYYQRINLRDKYTEKRIKYLTQVLKFNTVSSKEKKEVNSEVNLTKQTNNNLTEEKKEKRKAEYECAYCNKTYFTKKTLDTHKRSRKHREELEKRNIQIEIETQSEKGNKKEKKEKSKETTKESDAPKEETTQFIYQSEHSLFLTCNRCNESFKTRNDLILHIKACQK